MRIKRGKQYKKTVMFYKTNFNFQEPYEIILDGNFIQYCAKLHWNVKEMLMKLVGGIVHIKLSPCVYRELKDLHKSDKLIAGTINIAKSFRQDECKHEEILTPTECILKMIGKKNRHHYFVATQDVSLRETLRKIPSVPLIYFKHGLMTLDPPSEVSLIKCQRKEKIKLKPESSEKANLKLMLKNARIEKREEERQEKESLYQDKDFKKMKIELGVKRKAKGPNPLSCKKKQKIEDEEAPSAIKKIRRKRKPKDSSTQLTNNPSEGNEESIIQE
ncbi:unnamed protein product [Blepharisma stoltei]|uniref:UTP23 sensor motif region domain-containing protein n=1 Tax=Blepharisma stoltei TaxID=1481888 RepID=A0AAU9IRH6_9CILI|nr:unnamed protein product [Blepharisma stoltei]